MQFDISNHSLQPHCRRYTPCLPPPVHRLQGAPLPTHMSALQQRVCWGTHLTDCVGFHRSEGSSPLTGSSPGGWSIEIHSSPSLQVERELEKERVHSCHCHCASMCTHTHAHAHTHTRSHTQVRATELWSVTCPNAIHESAEGGAA